MQRKSMSHNQIQFSVGIDVSKATLDICILNDISQTGKLLKVSNAPDGHKHLITQLSKFCVSLVIIEPTGRYHQKLHQVLEKAGFKVAVINPYRSRKFADTLGQLAKSDVIDARMLALFGLQIKPPITPAPTKLLLQINAMVLARSSLIADQTALKNRLGASDVKQLTILFAKRIRQITRDIALLDKSILSLIKTDKKLSRWNEILLSIPGIGQISAMILIATMPEMGQINNKQIAALVGVAPMNWDSGIMRGKRKTKGGRFEVRRALYMPALTVATRLKGGMNKFYMAMLKRGKPAKVALTAIMRKLIILANTLIKNNTKWIPDYA